MTNYLIFSFTRNIIELRTSLALAEQRAEELSRVFPTTIFNVVETKLLISEYKNGIKQP